MAFPRTPGLQRLPFELVSYVIEDLEVEDVFNLSICCKHFEYIIRTDKFCKPVVMAKESGTLEAREALVSGNFARALRRIVKRRNALLKAAPYAVGILACADSYEYVGGKLLYIVRGSQRSLRILDVHKWSDWELFIDIPMLIHAAFPQEPIPRRYGFVLLHQAAGIVSCLYTLEDGPPRLLIIKPEEHKILETYELESRKEIFVRNNDKYLYFGTFSGQDADGLTIWVLKGFDLQRLSWMPQPRLFLEDFTDAADIGENVCFEIIGEHFYGVSSKPPGEIFQLDAVSTYGCFRFPLDQPSVDKMEWMNDEDSWRRMPTEGPINQHWTFLSLERDEATGNPVILECRGEYQTPPEAEGTQQLRQRRTYYTTEVIFRPEPESDEQDRPHSSALIRRRQPQYVHPADHSSIKLDLHSKSYFHTYIRSCQTFLELVDDPSEGTGDAHCVRIRAGHRVLNSACRGNEMPQAGIPETGPLFPPYEHNELYIWPPRQASPEAKPSLDMVQKLLNIDGRIKNVAASGDERCIVYDNADGSKRSLKTLVLISFDPATRLDNMECGVHIPSQQVPDVPEGTLAPDPNLVAGLGAEDRAGRSSPAHDLDPSTDDSAPIMPPVAEGAIPWASWREAMHLDLDRKVYLGR